MPLAAGARLGPYEVVERIGAGGMGVVYRARDVTLQRDVALKVLPDAFSDDPERLQRFTREAQTLAALNHPNIAHVHGFEDRGDARALVMEYVEGEDLAARLLRGPLAIGDALPIARQLAVALEAAHDQGIIHRDLKPANIKVRPDGTVKVLDFGLAKMLDPPDIASGVGVPDVTTSPTITTPAVTRLGVILGTAAYMSPEQAKGLPADKRSDIWAFGCVLFEMLSGARPFEADDVSDTLAAVLMREPQWSRLPPDLPRAIQTLLQRCLERDRAKRMSNIAGALFALDETFVAMAPRSTSGVSRWRASSGWIAAIVLTIVAAFVIATRFRTTPADSPTMRLQVMTPSGGNGVAFALSPDGRSIVLSGRVDGQSRSQLLLRRFESDQDQPLPGTEDATYPFWSPDSRSVAFFAGGLLKRIDLASGFVRTIANAPEQRRGDWNREGTILFGASAGPLLKVSDEGGPVVEATSLLPGQSSHRFPQFLPDGRRFLMVALGESHAKGLYLASLDDKRLTRLSDGEPSFALLPSYVLITREGALWAQRFNADSGTVDGELLPVAPRIWTTQVSGSAALSSSAIGSFAFRATAESRQLTWLDRTGRPVGMLGEPDPGQPNQLSLSADGQTAAVIRTVNGNRDVWLVDTARGSFRRFTFGPSVEGQAVFSPDNRSIAYASDPNATLWDVYERQTDGTGGETILRANPENEYPIDWSSDGRYLLFVRQDVKTDQDILALPLFGDRRPVPLAATTFYESEAKFSPDGRWIAFTSNETGRSEVYVQPFPGPGAKIQFSIAGGRTPRWSRGTPELFYIAADNRLMAIPIKANGSTINGGVPRALLTLRETEEFVPSPDGQRFLINRVVSDAAAITIVLNWQPTPSR